MTSTLRDVVVLCPKDSKDRRVPEGAPLRRRAVLERRGFRRGRARRPRGVGEGPAEGLVEGPAEGLVGRRRFLRNVFALVVWLRSGKGTGSRADMAGGEH